MARGKTITTQSLVALGAGPLADLLIEQAELDPGLRKKLAMLLAAAQGGGKLADEIDKRLRTIARSRSYLDWEKAKALVRELDHLRGAIASRLAETDHTRAVEMLWTFIAMADQVTRRVGERGALAEAVFDAAMVDLGRISAAAPPPDRAALARRVLAYSDSDDLGLGDVFIRHMSEALGPDGRAEIGRAAESALRATPGAKSADDWDVQSRRRRLAFRLALLADLDHDADAYVAAVRAGELESTHSLEVAKRLLDHGRAAEALQWIDRPRIRFRGREADDVQIDLKIAALEALGRGQEAQAVRWDFFERELSAVHLRAFLKGLPDFEDFEAEQKALDVAQAHEDALGALAFFLEWPAFDRADRLVRERPGELDGRVYELLRPSAEALEAKYPEAASLLYRRMIEAVLDRAASAQYKYAARDLAACALIGPRLPRPGSIESHDAFLVRLRQSHGRKYGFWMLVEPS